MRKLIAGMALAALAGGANATLTWNANDVFDSATGLDWLYLTKASPFVDYGNLANGQRLATAFEVSTFFADANLVPLSGTFVQPGMPGPSAPPGLDPLRSVWGAGVNAAVAQGSLVQFITAANNQNSDYVGTGSITTSYIGNYQYRYEAYINGNPILFSQYAASANYFFGAALVTGPAAVYAIPEPSTYALMVVGLAAGLILHRRSTKL